MGIVWRKATRSRPAWAAAAAVTIVTVGFLAACSPASSPPRSPSSAERPASAAPSGGVVTLNAISTLKSLFNRADGHPRLVLIFSPT